MIIYLGQHLTPCYQFFFKATLLQQVDDLLKGIQNQLNGATELVNNLEKSLRPILKELDELQEKIKNMEFVEEISQQVQLLKKKLAWSWVYDADKKLEVQNKLIEKLKGRIPTCQARIDQQHVSHQCISPERDIFLTQFFEYHLFSRVYELHPLHFIISPLILN